MKFLEFRVYEGTNIYSFQPVVKLTVDLEDLAEVTTDQPKGFVDRLLTLMPSLYEHHCSLGRPGGFVDRLREGTYFGHLLEHLILELQYLAGVSVIYGKTRKVADPGIYDVVFEVESAEGGIQAARSGLKIITALLEEKQSLDVKSEVALIKDVIAKTGLGPSTKAIAVEAKKRDIPVMSLGEGSILQLGYGCYQRRVEASITDNTSCIGVDIAGDKVLTKQLLSEAGIPVPLGGVARTEKEACDIAERIKEAVVVKPFNGNQGKGVALNLDKVEHINKAFMVAQSYNDKVIVEKYITGRHYRLLVVDGRLVAASERLPASVTGDGKNTIRELVRQVNSDPLRGDGHEKPLSKISVDPVVLMVLAKQGLTLDSVPEEGHYVLLRENANLSTGGIAIDVTDVVHRENSQMAIRAAKIIGLDVAGIDIVAEDIALPISQGNGAVIEVNAAPGLRMHLYPAEGEPRNVATAIVDKLFPAGAKSRIPIVAVTGTNGKTTTTRLISHVVAGTGAVVGMATSDGIVVNGDVLVQGDTTGPASARTVLRDPSVQVAVLETARGGILRAGLGFDRCEVGIITNVSDDHLGLDGVNTLEDMAYIKSLVAEATCRNGHVVLNAEDRLVASMVAHCRAKIIYFARTTDNIIVRRHLSEGGQAVFVKRGYIVAAYGNKSTTIAPVKAVPCTLSGLALHNLENALAAVAGCLSLGLSPQEIRDGLLTFQLDLSHNPGRLNLFEVDGIQIIVDYGHNAAGYKHVLAAAKKLNRRRLIGVIGVPGDRQDDAILAVGEIAGSGFDRVVIKEDMDRRGRAVGEVAELLKRGALKGGMSPEGIDFALKEGKAVLKALETAEAGDLVIIFYEKLGPVVSVINTFKDLIKVKKVRQKSSEGIEKKLTV